MMNPALPPDASLPEYLIARARAASDGRLVLDVAVGSIGSILLAAWRPVAWVSLLGASVCLAVFGLWGITDRVIRERAGADAAWPVRALRAVRFTLGCVGFVAAVMILFAGLGVALGTWIS